MQKNRKRQGQRGLLPIRSRAGRAFAWLIVTLLVVALAACSADDATPPPPSTVTSETSEGTAVAAPAAVVPTREPLVGKVVLWHSWSERDGDALAAILQAFAEDNPQVTVDTLFVGYNDLPQGYADAVLAGGGPDVVLSANWWLRDMVSAGVVQPLDQLVSPAELDEYLPAALDTLRRDGTLYGLPTHFETAALFYNKTLVGDTPLPQSTEELLALASKDPSQGIGLYTNLYHLIWGFPAYGSSLFDADGKIVLDQGTGAANYLQWLKRIDSTPGSYVDIDYGMLLDRFKKEEFAFFVDGPWAIPELRDALGDKLAVTSLPRGASAPAQPWLSADGVFLNPNLSPEQQKVALAFARFVTNPESGSALATIAQRLPANRNVTIADDALLAGFLKQAEEATAIETRPEMENVWGYGGDMIAKVLNDVSEPAAAVREATALINDVNGK